MAIPIALIFLVGVVLSNVVAAQERVSENDCNDVAAPNRIEACSKVIETVDTTPEQRAVAYANRGLLHAVAGRYPVAIEDYNRAIELFPYFHVALNNRGWTYFRMGLLKEAYSDVQDSLFLNPDSPHSLDTRAHIYQVRGEKERARKDYIAAVRIGGAPIVAVYQCGLKKAGLFSGTLDGNLSPEFEAAILACVNRGKECDPVPLDSELSMCGK